MAAIFIILLFLLLLSDAYIVFGVMGEMSWLWKGLLLLPMAFYCMVIVKVFLFGDWRQSMLNLLFWSTLCVVFPSLIFALLSLLGKGIGLVWNPARTIFNVMGLLTAVGFISISLYGIIIGWKKVTVERVTISSPNIPKTFDGYRIIQLSDFHIGTYGEAPETVSRIVDEVNALNPDLIVFTGDLVNSSADEVKPFVTELSRLKAKDGILAVLGNHDYCLYRDYIAPDTPAKELAKVIATEEKIGWKLLRNEHFRIRKDTDSIAIIGVDNAGSRMFPDKSDLPKAIKGLSGSEFKILLSHDPSHWRREVLPATDIDLMLAGHTHAMQFKLGNWSPSKYTYPEWGGMYTEGAQRLYVSTGIGENIAFRFGAYPQIVEILLKSN